MLYMSTYKSNINNRIGFVKYYFPNRQKILYSIGAFTCVFLKRFVNAD
jgi:hypothetical protein